MTENIYQIVFLKTQNNFFKKTSKIRNKERREKNDRMGQCFAQGAHTAIFTANILDYL